MIGTANMTTDKQYKIQQIIMNNIQLSEIELNTLKKSIECYYDKKSALGDTEVATILHSLLMKLS
jgi:hypothetical protein